MLYLVLPRYIRQNNIAPFDSWDALNKRVYKEICGQLRLVLGMDFKSKLRSVECNITKRVCCFASTSDVLNLLNHALLSPKDDNLEYSGQSKECALKKEIHTVISRKAHYYTLKTYDKTEEYRKKCKEHGGKEDDIEDNMLRIEIILLGRTIDKYVILALASSEDFYYFCHVLDHVYKPDKVKQEFIDHAPKQYAHEKKASWFIFDSMQKISMDGQHDVLLGYIVHKFNNDKRANNKILKILVSEGGGSICHQLK